MTLRKRGKALDPIKIVFFKGGNKPISKQYTHKQLVMLYSLVASLVFLILFASMIIYMLYQERSEALQKCVKANDEIENLKQKIVWLNSIFDSRGIRRSAMNTTQEEPAAEEKKPESRASSGINQKPLRSEKTPDDSPPVLPADRNRILDNAEKIPAKEIPDVKTADMKADIFDFKIEKDEASGKYRFSYWIANSSAQGVRLEGRAVVILHAEDRILSYPSVTVSNGIPDIGKRGILFRINFRKDMKGEIGIPFTELVINEAMIVLSDLDGKEILRRSYPVSFQ